MKQILLIAAATAGVAGLLAASVSEPAAWALLLAGVAGAGFVGRPKGKPSIEADD